MGSSVCSMELDGETPSMEIALVMIPSRSGSPVSTEIGGGDETRCSFMSLVRDEMGESRGCSRTFVILLKVHALSCYVIGYLCVSRR